VDPVRHAESYISPATPEILHHRLMEIRHARRSEADAVTRLAAEAFGHYVERIGAEPMPMRADYAALIAQQAVWVAVAGPEVAGVLVLLSRDDHLLLDVVAVAPAQQGQGLGRRLIEFAEQQAMSQGLGEVRLYTNVLMTENRALYPRLGYREVGTSHEHGLDRVHFAKQVGVP
jgi:ribosomal protein S18 acetylase RimI-like enzyme